MSFYSQYFTSRKKVSQNILTRPSSQILDISSSHRVSVLWLTNVLLFASSLDLQSTRQQPLSACLPVEWQILSMTTRPYFCLAFGWRGLHATTTLAKLNWTFCLGVFNASSKSTDEREGQLFYRTAETIVCVRVYVCLETRTAPGCKLHCRAE